MFKTIQVVLLIIKSLILFGKITLQSFNLYSLVVQFFFLCNYFFLLLVNPMNSDQHKYHNTQHKDYYSEKSENGYDSHSLHAKQRRL